MKIVYVRDILLHELQDIYSAEQQVISALPKLAEQASSGKLKKSFLDHHQQTLKQLKRLQQISTEMNMELEGHFCMGMEGLIKESASLLGQTKSPAVDAGLISVARRIEHYEIAAYSSALAYAQALRKSKVVRMLQTSLNEELRSDKKLSVITQSSVLPKLTTKKHTRKDV